MCDEFRQSFTLLPRRSDPRIWVTKPTESRVKKLICRRSAPTAALSVEGPAENELRRTIVFSRHPFKPVVNKRRFPNASPGNDRNDIYDPGLPTQHPGKRYPPLDQKDRFL